MEWIDVNERLPEVSLYTGGRWSKAVLIWCKNNLCSFTAVYDRDEDIWHYFGGGDGRVYHDVTHWMPLPEPPK